MYKILLPHPKATLFIGIFGSLIPLVIMLLVIAQALFLVQVQGTKPTASTSYPQVKAVQDVFNQLSLGQSKNTSGN